MAGAAACALCSTAAGAQTAPASPAASDKTTLPDIVVTGTNIRGTAPVGSSVIAVTRKDIEETGATTVAQILQLQPQVLNFGITDASRSGTGGAANITYGTSINLRGLSPYATLTLFDGYRVDPSGTVGSAVDPNNLPSIMLQRVDVVADGASATYGSDAVAGVVNLIPRRNFDGLELQARGGWADDYSEQEYDALFGHKWSSGQITVGMEYTYNSPLSGEDRSYYSSNLTREGYADYRQNNCYPGTIAYNGQNYAIPAGGVTPATASGLVAGTQNRCDPLKSGDLLPSQQHYNVAATFNQDITPWLSFFVDAFYGRRDYERQSPYATGPLTVTSANPYYVAAPGNTSGSETVNYSFGGQGLGNTWTDKGYSENYNIVSGFKISLPYDWKMQLTGTYGRDQDQDEEVDISESSGAVAAALSSTNPATALNLFGSNSTALLKSLDNNLFIAPGTTTLTDFQAKVDGPLFTLPGGVVKAAIGVENEYQTVVDGLIQGTPQSPVVLFGGLQHLTRTWNSVYGELLVPIVGSQNSMPFVQKLDLDAGFRYTDYTVVGSTTNPKVGLNWTVDDSLKLHASWGTSFRAPQLSELVGPLVGVFYQTYATPSGPVSGYTTAGGNLGLRPETATTWSLGGDWTPSYAPHLRVTLNYFNINYSNQIASYLSNLNILENPAPYSALIAYCPSTACQALVTKYVSGPNAEPVFGPVLNENQIAVFVNGLNENLGTTFTDGLDFTVDYRIPDTAFGSFDLGVDGTYFLNYKQSFTPGSPSLDVLNTIGFPLRLRFRTRTSWTLGPWEVAAFVNYENGYTNNEVTPVEQVAAWTTLDLHAAYSLDSLNLSPWLKDSHIRLDVTNLFDTDPPFVAIIPNANGGGGFDPNVANPIGRIVALTVDKKF